MNTSILYKLLRRYLLRFIVRQLHKINARRKRADVNPFFQFRFWQHQHRTTNGIDDTYIISLSIWVE